MPTSEFLPEDTLTFAHSYAVLTEKGAVFSAGNAEEAFPLASVTKLLTSWGTLIAIDKGLITLVEPAGPDGSTVRHLLAHASGLPFGKGAVLARPGERRIYSNTGIEVLGEVVASHVGMPIGEWITREVLTPLAMVSTSVPGSPAYSGISTLRDMEKFAAELLRPTLISAPLASASRTVQFPGISGILPGYGRQSHNDWGLGFEIRDHKDPHWTGASFSPRTFGHFGQSGSFVWVDPTIRTAGIFLGERAFGPEHKAVWPALTDRMRALSEEPRVTSRGA